MQLTSKSSNNEPLMQQDGDAPQKANHDSYEHKEPRQIHNIVSLSVSLDIPL